MAVIALAPVTALLRAPITSRTAGCVPKAPLVGVPAMPRSSSAVSLGRSRRSTVVRASVHSVVSRVSQAVPELALAGLDTSALDSAFVSIASFILPAWGITVGTLFIFGTIAKVAFPDRYDAAVYKGKADELVGDEIIDLDNLSEEDLAAVAALEAERAAANK